MNINEFTFIDKNEKPLDNLVFNGGCCSVFKRICIIGDSLSAGEFEAKGEDGNTLFSIASITLGARIFTSTRVRKCLIFPEGE